ncbi:TetR family transcriptional regulator [Marisediminicola sp. LYQ134]|uniref:TetR family transcriptional regulator n=1 Tax=unclassified Marisediminicola TaxID=2618316 RepID=UPI0039836A4F
MSRRPDPERKPQLLSDILDYLADKPLSSVTFRAIADHLDVSAFAVVYHFGTKSNLVAEIVQAIGDRQRRGFGDIELNATSVDEYLEGIYRYWEWTLEPTNRYLHRLEVEAGMLQAIDHVPVGERSTLGGWYELVSEGLCELGIPDDTARVEARAMVNIMYGFQYDLVLLGEIEATRQAFDAMVEVYRHRLTDLIERARAAT